MADHCNLTANVTPIRSALEWLFSAAESDWALKERLVDLLEGPTQVLRAECKPAAGALEVTFFPADALLELLPAALADDLRGH